MGGYESLKAAVAAAIRQNGTEAITGDVLQDVLLSMISNMSAGGTFMGVAVPSTNPGASDGNVFWLAGQSGTYANFGGVTVAANTITILSNKTGSWTAEALPIPLSVTPDDLSEAMDPLIVGTVQASELDSLCTTQEELENLTLGKKTVYYKVFGAGGIGLFSGLLQLLTDGWGHVSTQILTTHVALNDDGTLSSSHWDDKLFTYWRRYDFRGATGWSKWQSVTAKLESSVKGLQRINILTFKATPRYNTLHSLVFANYTEDSTYEGGAEWAWNGKTFNQMHFTRKSGGSQASPLWVWGDFIIHNDQLLNFSTGVRSMAFAVDEVKTPSASGWTSLDKIVVRRASGTQPLSIENGEPGGWEMTTSGTTDTFVRRPDTNPLAPMDTYSGTTYALVASVPRNCYIDSISIQRSDSATVDITFRDGSPGVSYIQYRNAVTPGDVESLQNDVGGKADKSKAISEFFTPDMTTGLTSGVDKLGNQEAIVTVNIPYFLANDDEDELSFTFPVRFNPATASITGLIKLGSDTPQTVAANSPGAAAGRTYPLQLDTAGRGVVNVPSGIKRSPVSSVAADYDFADWFSAKQGSATDNFDGNEMKPLMEESLGGDSTSTVLWVWGDFIITQSQLKNQSTGERLLAVSRQVGGSQIQALTTGDKVTFDTDTDLTLHEVSVSAEKSGNTFTVTGLDGIFCVKVPRNTYFHGITLETADGSVYRVALEPDGGDVAELIVPQSGKLADADALAALEARVAALEGN